MTAKCEVLIVIFSLKPIIVFPFLAITVPVTLAPFTTITKSLSDGDAGKVTVTELPVIQ